MRKSLIAYALYGGSVLALYGTGGFSGWWKGMHLPRRTYFPGGVGTPGGSSGSGYPGGYPGGIGSPGGSSGHGGSSWGTGSGSSGGGFRGGK